MKHQPVWKALGLVLALCTVVPAYGQGVYWETVMTGGPGPMGKKERVSTMSHIPGRIKSVDADGKVMIVLIEKKMLYQLDPAKKTYSEMTFDELEGAMKEVAGAMDEKMAAMQKELESMPDDQRVMMEKMMKGKMPGRADAVQTEGKMEAKKTGKKETVHGRACSEVVVTNGGKDYMTAWVTNDVKEFDGMKDDVAEFRKLMAALNPMIPKGLTEAMKSMEGFPMRTEMKNGMKQEVRTIESRPIDAKEFEIPDGYTKVDSDLLDKSGH